jgi:hypothetical protein
MERCSGQLDRYDDHKFAKFEILQKMLKESKRKKRALLHNFACMLPPPIKNLP